MIFTSFMRGKYYVWVGSSKNIDYIYLWCGHDKAVDQSYWKDEMAKTSMVMGTSMPLKKFDELVAMRWAQMGSQQQKVSEKRALEKYSGNIGCDMLSKKYGKKTVREQLDEKVK